MNILFLNANLYGHINPTLGLVKKMKERGNKIFYFCSEPFAEMVTKAGAQWIGFSSNLNKFLKNYHPTDRHPFFMLMEYMLSYDEMMLEDARQILSENSYDLILCDSYFGGACFLKQMTKIPVICSHPSFAMSKTPVPERMLVPGYHTQLDHCYEILGRICEKYKIKEPSLEEVFVSRGEVNVLYTTCSFNGDANVKEPDYLFAGPSLDRWSEAADFNFFKQEGKKSIYISLGSINTDFVEFYKTCIQAFGGMDYVVYMSIGKKSEPSLLGEIPSNFIVRKFLPQLEILKNVEVFITHGGFNSINEALNFGVPMLVLPMVNDQHMVAKRIVDMQLGVKEDINKLTPKLLREEVEMILKDKKYKENCMQISQEMKNLGGLETVVDRLEKYVELRKEK